MRRPIATRDKTWAKNFARFLAKRGVTPNAVSGASVVCALGAFACLLATRNIEYSRWTQVALWLGAALFVQLRLLCNLFDGMLAVEFEKASALGAIYNDLPDRPADVLILVGAGYAISTFQWSPTIGWIAAVLALMNAYVRVLGVAIGAQERFNGPMAKPHRMAAITIACVLSAVETLFAWPHRVMGLALIFVAVGCVITIFNRLKLIARDLQSAKPETSSTR